MNSKAVNNGMIEEWLEYLRGDGYRNLRVLEDGAIVGTYDLIYTRAVFIDLEPSGFGRRYCYPDRELADKACNLLVTGDDLPIEGYVASRIVRG